MGYTPNTNEHLLGDPVAPTAAAGDNDTSVATTAFVTNAVAGVSSSTLAVNATGYRSAALSTATGVFSLVGFDAELDDTNTMHDLVTNNSRLVVPATKGGLYLITGLVTFAANATGAREANVRKNAAGSSAGGTEILDALVPAGGTLANTVPFSTVVRLAAADYVELFVAQNSGGALGLTTGSSKTFMSLTRIGA